MKLLKLFALLVLTWSTSVAMGAQEKVQVTLIVELQDGTMHCYEAQEKPIVTFSADASVVITTGNSTLVEYAKDEFALIYFSEHKSTKVDEVTVEAKKPVLTIRYVDGETLEVLTDCKGMLRLFSISGNMVKSQYMTDEGSAIISLTDVPAGIYLLNISNQTIKIRKR